MRVAKVGERFPRVIRAFDKIQNGADWDKFFEFGRKSVETVQIPSWERTHSFTLDSAFDLDCYILGNWRVQKEDDEHFIVEQEGSNNKIRVHKNCVKCIPSVDCYGKPRDMYIVRKSYFSIEEICEDENGVFVTGRDMTLAEIKKYVLDDETLSDEKASKMISTRDFVD